jgi:gliding motility-associated-like protein
MNRSICILALGLTCIAHQVTGQRPSVDFVNPAAASPGTVITIAGSGFSENAQQNRVMFGAAPAQVISAKSTLLEVVLPSGATYAPVSVTNLGSGLTGFSSNSFLSSYSGGQLLPDAFDPPFHLASEGELYDLCLCDFDLDGKNDIATANRNSISINIYHNRGAPSTLQFDTYTQNLNSRTINLNCGDLNGDGRPDLLLSRSGTPGDRIFVLINQSSAGNLSFAAPQYFLVDGIIARRIFLGDLDRDGKPDVLVTNQDNNRITVFRNTSAGQVLQLEPQPSIVIEDPVLLSDRTTAGISVADLNGDGFPEIVVSGFTQPNIFIVPNLSTQGSLLFGPVKELRMTGNLINLATGDLNHDGKIDIIATKILQNKVGVLINRTDLSASNSVMNIEFNNEVEIAVNDKPWGLDLGDINGDGRVDIVLASIESGLKRVALLENTSANGQFSYIPHFITTPETTRNVRVGDLDGDGKPDIALTSIETNKVTILRNKHCVTPRLLTSGPILACAGEEISIQASPASGIVYEWHKSDGVNQTSTSGSAPVFRDTPAEGSYQYWLVAKGEGGACTFTSPVVSVMVSPTAGFIPDPVIVDPGKVCAGQSLTLELDPASLAGDVDYTWTHPDGSISSGTQLTVSNPGLRSAGRYIVKAVRGSCQGTADSLLVEVLSPPALEVSSSHPLTFCQGYSVSLSVTSDPQFSYQWQRDNLDIAAAQGSTLTVSQGGAYRLRGLFMGSCPVESPVYTLTAVAPPVAGFDLPSAGTCAGQPVTFSNTSAVTDGIPVQYRWLNGDGGSSSDFNPVYTYTTAGNYTVELQVSYPDSRCASTITRILTISSAPTVTIVPEGDPEICRGESLRLNAGGAYSSYLWSNGLTVSSITVDQPGIYRLTGTDATGCAATAELSVEVRELPVISVNPSQATIADGESVLLEASGAETYQWTPEETLDDPQSASPLATPTVTTEYLVSGTDASGCTGTASVWVRISEDGPALDPSALLSPNGDGENDFWTIGNIDSYPEYTVTVFSRSGMIVFTASSYANDWNGTFRGQELEEDVYYYVISDDGAPVKTGTITLLR